MSDDEKCLAFMKDRTRAGPLQLVNVSQSFPFLGVEATRALLLTLSEKIKKIKDSLHKHRNQSESIPSSEINRVRLLQSSNNK